MKGNSDTYPEITINSNNKTQIRYNILEITKEDINGESRTSFNFDYIEIEGELTKEKIAASLNLTENQITINGIINSPPISLIFFNVNSFLLGLMQAFTPLTDYSNILVFYPMIADFARANNFQGINQFLQGLIAARIMTQDQFNKLNSVLLLQNIDLNNLS